MKFTKNLKGKTVNNSEMKLFKKIDTNIPK